MNKLRLISLICTLFFLLGCSKNEDETADSYFNDIIFVADFYNNMNNWDSTKTDYKIEVSNGVFGFF